jgi:hypothetical protein
VIDYNLPHDVAGNAQEVRAPAESRPLLFDQADVRFVNQRCPLQRTKTNRRNRE